MMQEIHAQVCMTEEFSPPGFHHKHDSISHYSLHIANESTVKSLIQVAPYLIVGNIIADHSDVAGALPISIVPITSSFST